MIRLRKLMELCRSNRREFWRVFRYLAVGGWNTVFGIGVYALLYWCWGDRVHYLLLTIPSNIIAITNAYFGYKFIVFRTRGNYWREYLRCYVVYGASMLLNAGLLALLVELSGMNPAAANLVVTFLVVAVSYFGHRFFSFREMKNHGR